jgi:hypothetical protein
MGNVFGRNRLVLFLIRRESWYSFVDALVAEKANFGLGPGD